LSAMSLSLLTSLSVSAAARSLIDRLRKAGEASPNLFLGGEGGFETAL
jgi:hypothetical protein